MTRHKIVCEFGPWGEFYKPQTVSSKYVAKVIWQRLHQFHTGNYDHVKEMFLGLLIRLAIFAPRNIMTDRPCHSNISHNNLHLTLSIQPK